MSAPSPKMLDMLTAALTSVPCGGVSFVFNDAEESQPDNFTTMTVDNGVRIFDHIPSLELANDMAKITNQVEKIRRKVYSK